MDTQSLVLLLGLGAVLGLVWYLKRPDITSQAARKLVSGGARLIDVRSTVEFERGHVDGARNIPLGEIERRARDLGEAERPIVVYCASGARSAAAKRMLKRAGFKQVYNLGAMSNW